MYFNSMLLVMVLSVMGAGSYNGRRNCELELKALYDCVQGTA